jgi:hypothetical protein
MGEIVAFRRPKHNYQVPPKGGAEILFFTGVRYQRGIEHASSPVSEPRSPEQGGGSGGVGGGKRRRRG